MFDGSLKNDYVIKISLDTKGFIRESSYAFCYFIGVSEKTIQNVHYTKLVKYTKAIYDEDSLKTPTNLENAISNPSSFSCYVLLNGDGFKTEAICRLLEVYNAQKQIIGTSLYFVPYMANSTKEYKTMLNKNLSPTQKNASLVINSFNQYYEKILDEIAKKTKDILLDCNFSQTITTSSIKNTLCDITQNIAKLKEVNTKHIEYSGISKTKSIVNINEVVEQSIDMLYKSLGIKSLEYLNFSGENSDDCNIHIDIAQVSQAFFYILQNAYEFSLSSRKPQITINVKLVKIETSKKIIIKIANNGDCILEEDSKLIYNPFFSTKTQTKNNALSLYFAQLILCNNHNMDLKNYNLKQGVVFEVSFDV